MKSQTLLSALSGGLQGWAIAFFETESLALQALVSVTPQRRHLWCAIWAQMSLRAERLDQAENIDLWRERLRYRRDVELINWAGFRDATGFRRVLEKLDWPALDSPETYLHIADILSRAGAAAKVLRHLKKVTAKAVHTLGILPAEACTVDFVERCQAGEVPHLRGVVRIPWRVERLRMLAPETLATWEAKVARGATLDRDLIDDLIPFPSPPWIGTHDLVPLDDAAKLSDASRRFQNCLTHHLSSVRDGASYFYELRDVAIVELERAGALGWEIAYALGPRNEALSPGILKRLAEALQGSPEEISSYIPIED